jgi:hypothetical protein
VLSQTTEPLRHAPSALRPVRPYATHSCVRPASNLARGPPEPEAARTAKRTRRNAASHSSTATAREARSIASASNARTATYLLGPDARRAAAVEVDSRRRSNSRRVRGGTEAPLGELGFRVERERLVQVGAHVVADRQFVDLVLADTVQHAAGQLGALRGVLREVAGQLAADLAVIEAADVDLAAPADATRTELARERCADDVDRRPHRALEQFDVEATRRRMQLVRAVGKHRLVEPDQHVQVDEPSRWYSATFTYKKRTSSRNRSCVRFVSHAIVRVQVDGRAPPEFAERLFQTTAAALWKHSTHSGSPRLGSFSACFSPQDRRTPCGQIGASRRGRHRRGWPSLRSRNPVAGLRRRVAALRAVGARRRRRRGDGEGLKVALARSKTDQEGRGPRGRHRLQFQPATCPDRAWRTRREASDIEAGPRVPAPPTRPRNPPMDDDFIRPIRKTQQARWALGRFPDRTYIHRSFRLNVSGSRAFGEPARWIVKVFDEPEHAAEPGDESTGLEWTEEVVRATRRSQVKVQIAGQAGEVRQLVMR